MPKFEKSGRVVRAILRRQSEEKPCQVDAPLVDERSHSQRALLNEWAPMEQIAFPFWLESDDQAVRFLQDVAGAVPEMPFILYNTTRSKKPLTVDR
jgi:hypothetical protein